MTTTQITTFDYKVPADWYGDYADDYDTDAVDDAVLKELNALLPSGVSIARNGMVFADVAVADEARELDFREFMEDIDVDAIAQRYDIGTR